MDYTIGKLLFPGEQGRRILNCFFPIVFLSTLMAAFHRATFFPGYRTFFPNSFLSFFIFGSFSPRLFEPVITPGSAAKANFHYFFTFLNALSL